MTLTVAQIIQRRMVRIGMELKGISRGLFQDTIPGFAWRSWGKPRKPSIRLVSVTAKILTWYLLNTSQKGYHLNQLARKERLERYRHSSIRLHSVMLKHSSPGWFEKHQFETHNCGYGVKQPPTIHCTCHKLEKLASQVSSSLDENIIHVQSSYGWHYENQWMGVLLHVGGAFASRRVHGTDITHSPYQYMWSAEAIYIHLSKYPVDVFWAQWPLNFIIFPHVLLCIWVGHSYGQQICGT
jgi:hypothetical protein